MRPITTRILAPALLVLAVLATAAAPLHAQLTVSMRDVDFSGLPRITFKACVSRGGALLRGLDSSNFFLIENGTPQPLTIRCPDPDKSNSVIEVLDNSGSMFSVLPKLIEAAGILVDSIDANDEAAILSFGRTITLNQDFTKDRALLKSALQALNANGGTPLYDASYTAIQLAGARAGNRHAVIITDGEDNQSTYTVDDVIALANTEHVKCYTIAFNISAANQAIMKRIADETGGFFFVVERPGELAEVYRRIAAQITEKCCLAEYRSASCADTLRDLMLTVNAVGEVAHDRQVFSSPSRPTQTLLYVDVPDALSPRATGMGFIGMVPPPSLALELSLAFTLTYDEDLVDIVPPIPFTLGTVTQNQVVQMTKIGRSALRFTLSHIHPALATGRLVGFSMQAMQSDSSRRVPFAISDIELEGCQTTFTAGPDSTSVCQCMHPFDVAFASPTVILSGSHVSIPVLVRGGLELGIGMLGQADIALPPAVRLTSVVPGALVPDGALQWSTPSTDIVRLTIPESTLPLDTAGVLATIEGEMTVGSNIRTADIVFTRSGLWQRCCPEHGDLPTIHIVQDGLCERVLERTGSATVTVSPNPVVHGSQASARVYIPADAQRGAAALVIADTYGRTIRTLFEGTASAGVTDVPVSIGSLPSGSYHLVLRSSAGTSSTPLVILR